MARRRPHFHRFRVEDDFQFAATAEFDSLVQMTLLALPIEKSGNDTGIPSDLRLVAFEFVDFLHHDEGNDDVIVLKFVDRGGIMQKNIPSKVLREKLEADFT